MKKKIFGTLLLGAFFLTSMSVFTSCKDYDDDIDGLRADLTALQTELRDAKSGFEADLRSAKADYESQIAVAKTELQAAIDQKADKSVITELQNRVGQLETDFTALESSLTLRIQAVETALDSKASKEELANAVATLTGKVSDEADVRKAADDNLQLQIDILNDFMKKVNDADYQKQIDELVEKLKNINTDSNFEQLRKDLEQAQKDILSVNANLDALRVLVERALSSISLVPDLFINGIEAIEFKSLSYVPKKAGTSGEVNLSEPTVLIDNGTAEATYRLNPSTVDKDCYDESGIEYVAAIAQTRGVIENSPVSFNGVKSFKNGLMTVYLKKNVTTSLNLTNGQIYIVSLKVPRNADKYEAADIYSENSRLAETTFTPRIAELVWSNHTTITTGQHYWTKSEIYASKVDATPLDKVKIELDYKQDYDLTQLVTGCYLNSASAHTQITKDELKKYGLAFRFYVNGDAYYNDVDHNTNQQKFASVTPEGIITSQIENGTKYNEACVGKEPIIRIELQDTVRGKLVDERYMKVKWVLKKLDDVVLPGYESTAVLNPCGETTSNLTWQHFINNIYGKANQEAGMSQSKFEAIYPVANIEVSNPTNFTLISTPQKNYPDFKPTTNENGDAVIATWTLDASDIQTIVPNNSKTFTVLVRFKSSIPSEYPDLVFTWTFTITLPTLPSINGFYDDYWFNKYDLHDVMPVQYKTSAYDNQLVANGPIPGYDPAQNTVAPGTPYCVFFNNLMNAFTYSADGFIVKDLNLTCGTWDMQFSQTPLQTMTGYAPGYTGAEPEKTSEPWNTFGAYKFFKGTAQALQMVWDDGHVSWCGNPAHYQANLFADHHNLANQGLLNPLQQTNEADGITPLRTHDKKVHMSIWATLNQWNYIRVKDYDICLVEPLRINAQLKGAFEEGTVSGTAVDGSNAFTMTDFRGYEVAMTTTNTRDEHTKYAADLWKYYEVEEIEWQLNDVRYGMKKANGSVVVDDNLTYANAMTAAEISQATNGNIVLSVTQQGNLLVFKNNGGSNVETACNVFIPVQVKYGFGTLKTYVSVRLYPKGQVPAGVTIIYAN